ncbi:MAG: HAMP domain-containing histidine kinase [Alphaproteobacteria bacterium]|nr:HAMP domain-containing histidine kinase [Alphaproteobacteria bacterium]
MRAHPAALRRRQATIVPALLVCLLASSVSTLLGVPFVDEKATTLAWVVGFGAIEGAALAISLRGHHTAAAWLLTAMLSVGTGLCIAIYGGLTGSLPSVFFAWLVVAAAALPTRDAIVVAVGVYVESLLLLAADQLWFDRPFDPNAAMVYLSTLPVVSVMAIATVAMQDRALVHVMEQEASRSAQQEALAREQRRALELAREASEQKSRFLANMSHELRTPLTAIIGYTELVLEDASAGEREPLGHVRSAAHQLLALIDDVLDLSRVEAGKMVLHREEIDLDALIERVGAMVTPLIERNGNQLHVFVPEPLGVGHVDGGRVTQILHNLLANAAKFTSEGEIGLSARMGVQAGVRLLHLRVTDDGIGISHEQQGRLFQPFGQADETTSHRFGGTGLGLVLCRHFTHLMGGTLTLTSEIGEGTAVEVVLPLPLTS